MHEYLVKTRGIAAGFYVVRRTEYSGGKFVDIFTFFVLTHRVGMSKIRIVVWHSI